MTIIKALKIVGVLVVIAIITFLILFEILDLSGPLTFLIDNQTQQTLEITGVNYSDNIARWSSLGFVTPGQFGIVGVDDDADYCVIYARNKDNEMIYKKMLSSIKNLEKLENGLYKLTITPQED